MSSISSRYIDPVADAYETKTAAERPSSLSEAKLGLVDSMLNPGAMWGQGMLDAAAEFLSRKHRSLSFARVARPPVGGTLARALGGGHGRPVQRAGDSSRRLSDVHVAQCARHGGGGGRRRADGHAGHRGAHRHGEGDGSGLRVAGPRDRHDEREPLRRVAGADRRRRRRVLPCSRGRPPARSPAPAGLSVSHRTTRHRIDSASAHGPLRCDVVRAQGQDRSCIDAVPDALRGCHAQQLRTSPAPPPARPRRRPPSMRCRGSPRRHGRRSRHAARRGVTRGPARRRSLALRRPR